MGRSRGRVSDRVKHGLAQSERVAEATRYRSRKGPGERGVARLKSGTLIGRPESILAAAWPGLAARARGGLTWPGLKQVVQHLDVALEVHCVG